MRRLTKGALRCAALPDVLCYDCVVVRMYCALNVGAQDVFVVLDMLFPRMFYALLSICFTSCFLRLVALFLVTCV
jgi:hypothetical protein